MTGAHDPTRPPPGPGSLARPLRGLVEGYLSVDRRVLGLFRVYFGLVLLYDIARRAPHAATLYSNEGVLANHALLFSPQATPQFSIFFPFSSPGEVRVAFGLTALVYLLFTLGLFTRAAQALALLCFTSLTCRNLFLEDGGVVVVSTLLTFTLILPLGDRFSIDGLRMRFARTRDPSLARPEGPEDQPVAVSLAVLALTLQTAIIYFFNLIHKSGSTWKHGEAVHWVLWQNRIAQPLAVLLRRVEPAWFSPLASFGALLIEGSMPLLVLSPVRRGAMRTAAFVLGLSLHLGIALMMSLGPFSYAMIALLLLLLPGERLDDLASRCVSPGAVTTVVFDRRHPGALFLCRVLASFDRGGLLRFRARAWLPDLTGAEPGDLLAARVEGEAEWVWGEPAARLALSSIPAARWLARLLGLRPGRALLERVLGASPETMARSEDPVTVVAAPPRVLFWLREGAVAFAFTAVLIQVSIDNPAFPERYRLAQPALLAPVIEYLRLLQGWRMFSPDAPRDDGILVVDGVTRDGRHLDPFTGQAPNFEGAMKPLVHEVPISDYLFAIHLEGNRRYLGELRRYVTHWQQYTGRPAADELVSFQAWWVHNLTPPPGSRRPYALGKDLVTTEHDD